MISPSRFLLGLTAVGSTSTLAQPRETLLFVDTEVSSSETAEPGVERQRLVEVRVDSLRGTMTRAERAGAVGTEPIVLNLFEDVLLLGILDRVERRGSNGSRGSGTSKT